MKREVKLLLISASALSACVASYVFFFLVSWKLLAGIVLANFSRSEYDRLMKALAEEKDETPTPNIHDDIEKDW